MNEHDQDIILHPEKKRKFFSLKKFTGIIFIILMVALLGFNFYNQAQISSLVDSNNKLKALLESSLTETTAANNHFSELQSSFKAYASQTESQQLLLNDLSKTIQNPTLQLKLAHLENLISIAETQLKVNKDIINAKSVLTIADNYLADDTHPQLINLRKIILSHIEQLNETKSEDLLKVSAHLDNFIKKINGIDAIDLMFDKQQFNQNRNIAPSLESSSETGWRAALTKIKNVLLNLVTVHKLDEQHSNKLNRLLTDEQIFNLKLYLQSKAAQADISLHQHQADNYYTIIKQLEEDVNLYFINNEKLKLQLLDLLKACKDIDLATEMPDLSSLYSEIRKVNK